MSIFVARIWRSSYNVENLQRVVRLKDPARVSAAAKSPATRPYRSEDRAATAAAHRPVARKAAAQQLMWF
jgi:hypothetical protein